MGSRIKAAAMLRHQGLISNGELHPLLQDAINDDSDAHDDDDMQMTMGDFF